MWHTKFPLDLGAILPIADWVSVVDVTLHEKLARIATRQALVGTARSGPALDHHAFETRQASVWRLSWPLLSTIRAGLCWILAGYLFGAVDAGVRCLILSEPGAISHPSENVLPTGSCTCKSRLLVRGMTDRSA